MPDRLRHKRYAHNEPKRALRNFTHQEPPPLCSICSSYFPYLRKAHLTPLYYHVCSVYSPILLTCAEDCCLTRMAQQQQFHSQENRAQPRLQAFKSDSRFVGKNEDFCSTKKVAKVRDFMESPWSTVGSKEKIQYTAIKDGDAFQKVVDLPTGEISELLVKTGEGEHMSVLLWYKLRRWNEFTETAELHQFQQEVMLPRGTDVQSLTYKLQKKESNSNIESGTKGLRNSSTASYRSSDGEEGALNEIENAVIIFGKLRNATQPTTEYKTVVTGEVRISSEGNIVPLISRVTQQPRHSILPTASPLDDTDFALLEDELLISIELDKGVNREKVKYEIDTLKRSLSVLLEKQASDEDEPRPNGSIIYSMVKQTFNMPSEGYMLEKVNISIVGDILKIRIPFVSETI